MENKSFRNKLARVQSLQHQADQLAQRVTSAGPITIGTLSLIKKKCGNPTCHCAQGEGHPTWTLLTKHRGKRRCQVVRKKDVECISKRVKEYRCLKDALRKIRATDSAKHRLLREVIQQLNEIYK